MKDSNPSELYRCSAFARIDTLAPGFGQYDFNPVVIQVMVDGPGGVAATANTGDQVVGIVAALFDKQLFFDLLTDNRLQAGYHVGIGVRTNC